MKFALTAASAHRAINSVYTFDNICVDLLEGEFFYVGLFYTLYSKVGGLV